MRWHWWQLGVFALVTTLAALLSALCLAPAALWKNSTATKRSPSRESRRPAWTPTAAWDAWSADLKRPDRVELAIQAAPRWLHDPRCRARALLRLAALYRYGFFPTHAAHPVAARICLDLAVAASTGPSVLAAAQQLRTGLYDRSPDDAFADTAQSLPLAPGLWPPPPMPPSAEVDPEEDEEVFLGETVPGILTPPHDTHDVVMDTQNVVMDTQNVVMDTQNVHSHVLQSSAKQAFNRDDMTAFGDNDPHVVQRVAMALQRTPGLTPQEREDADRVLCSLTDQTHSRLGVSEKQALARVWGRIQADPNRDALTETLGKVLSTGVEHGHVVCSTGKIMRVLGSLDGTGVVSLKTDTAVDAELLHLAAQVRRRVLDDADVQDRQAYETGVPGLAGDRVRRAMSEALMRDAQATYDGLIDPAVLEGKIAPLQAAY
jgi:hypothetical protein